MKSALIIAFFALFSIGGLTPVHAQQTAETPTFALPLACTPGVDCWVMNYMDLGPADDGKATDPFCGTRTYDGNKGTGFALADKKALQKLVPVLAARDGKILRVRSTEFDRGDRTEKDLKEIKDAQKECGNAILIDHGNGLQTIYCHLKKDSMKFKVGDAVKEGDEIASVGMSGYTTFPQLHFGIIWEGAIVDPFTGLNSTDTCGTIKKPLWKDTLTLPYTPVSLYAAGFSTQTPTLDVIDKGEGAAADPVPSSSNIFSFWTTIFGVQDGDMITIDITAPNGKSFAKRTIKQKGTYTRQLYFTGRKLQGSLLMPGVYTGKTVLTRTMKDGKTKDWTINRSITVQDD